MARGKRRVGSAGVMRAVARHLGTVVALAPSGVAETHCAHAQQHLRTQEQDGRRALEPRAHAALVVRMAPALNVGAEGGLQQSMKAKPAEPTTV